MQGACLCCEKFTFAKAHSEKGENRIVRASIFYAATEYEQARNAATHLLNALSVPKDAEALGRDPQDSTTPQGRRWLFNWHDKVDLAADLEIAFVQNVWVMHISWKAGS